MRYTEALDAHIDMQYARYLTYKHIPDDERLTREEFIAPDYHGDTFEMTATVARLVAEKQGELVTFGVFDNCREHGLTVSSFYGWTFCWYEHRNSDDLHIEGCETTQVQPWGPYAGVDKYDTLWRTGYGDYIGIAAGLNLMLDEVAGKKGAVTRDDMKRVGSLAILS